MPNFRLRMATEQPMFARTPVVTMRSGLGALRLKLWDEERGCLVRCPRSRPAQGRAVVAQPPSLERAA
jgi:hypothetical protein